MQVWDYKSQTFLLKYLKFSVQVTSVFKTYKLQYNINAIKKREKNKSSLHGNKSIPHYHLSNPAKIFCYLLYLISNTHLYISFHL